MAISPIDVPSLQVARPISLHDLFVPELEHVDMCGRLSHLGGAGMWPTEPPTRDSC
jgi:hypothetical protein